MLVGLVRTRRGARGLVAAEIAEHRRVREHVAQPVFHESPRPAISRLFLHPADFPRLSVPRQDRLNFLFRKRVELLDAGYGDVLEARLVARSREAVEDFS